jgi:hypothetical protein
MFPKAEEQMTKCGVKDNSSQGNAGEGGEAAPAPAAAESGQVQAQK